MAHERAKARKVALRAVFIPLGLALHPQDRPGNQTVQHVQHVAQQRSVFLRIPPAQRRAAVGTGHQPDGIAQIAFEALGKVQPRAVAGVVVFIVPHVHRARSLAQRMGGQVPAPAGAQHAHPRLGIVRHGVLGPAGGIALPGDDEHIAHAHVMHHVPAGAGKPVPVLVGHGGLKSVQPAGGHGGKGDAPSPLGGDLALGPGNHGFAGALQRHAGLDDGLCRRHLGEGQRELLRKAHQMVGSLQADGRGTLRPLLKNLPRGRAPLDDDASVHRQRSFMSRMRGIDGRRGGPSAPPHGRRNTAPSQPPRWPATR